jgi:hypothetical protein
MEDKKGELTGQQLVGGSGRQGRVGVLAADSSNGTLSPEAAGSRPADLGTACRSTRH